MFDNNLDPTRCLILSRDPAVVQYLRRELPALADAPVERGRVNPVDVAGLHLFGIVPLRLAAHAVSATVVEYRHGAPHPPFTLADMDRAGAYLVSVQVHDTTPLREILARRSA